jgi:hypothetical protein
MDPQFVLYKLSFTQNIFLHPLFLNILNLFSQLWLFYIVFIQHLLFHMFNKSIPQFPINMWPFSDHMLLMGFLKFPLRLFYIWIFQQ